MINILIVDDQDVDRFLLKSLLTTVLPTLHINGIINEASSGDEALEMCHTAHFDIIFMDIVMPNLSGIDATKQVREYDLHTVIFGMSSFHDEESEQIILEAGADYFIQKPVYSDTILPLLKNILPILEKGKR